MIVKKEHGNKQVYFVGGGIASLAGAAYLVRDCDFPGEHIHIIEEMPILGGSNDGAGNPDQGYIIRGGRMLNDEAYENLWELLASIPSIDRPGISVRQEITKFGDANPTHSNARLINRDGKVEDVLSMGFDMADRLAMGKLIITPEDTLGKLRINDWFGPHFSKRTSGICGRPPSPSNLGIAPWNSKDTCFAFFTNSQEFKRWKVSPAHRSTNMTRSSSHCITTWSRLA